MYIHHSSMPIMAFKFIQKTHTKQQQQQKQQQEEHNYKSSLYLEVYETTLLEPYCSLLP